VLRGARRMKRHSLSLTTEEGTTATREVPRAMADLLEVSGVVDRACNQMSMPSAQLLEASRAIHRALLSLYDWSDAATSQPAVSTRL
jgi:hypothetical protein